MHGSGGFPACAHGKNDRRSPGRYISACPHAGLRGLSGRLIDDDIPLLSYFQPGCSCGNKRIRAIADVTSR